MSESWYTIRNEADEAEVRIYDSIGAFGISAEKFVGELQTITASKIRLRINTPGGGVFDATAIYNALRSHPAHVVSDIEGAAASAGSWIALAGDEVRMADNAYMMIHNAQGAVMGEAEEMRKTAETLDMLTSTIAGMYEKKTGKPKSHWLNLMNKTTWFTAEQAKAEGLVDEIYGGEKKKTRNRLAFNEADINNLPAPVQEFWGLTNQSATEPSASAEPEPIALSQETQQMAEATVPTVPTAQSTAAVNQGSAGDLASLNAQAIQGYIDKGRAIGKLEGQRAAEESFKAIYAAAPGRPDIAANAFLAGQNAATVSLIFDADNKARQEARAELLAKETEIARLHAVNATGGHPGVPVNPSFDNNVIPQGLDPEAQAKLEWDSDPLVRAKNTDQKKWMLYRVNQLKGGVRVLSR
jgi:ATP-dependent protease ClpP protease subunit